MPLFSGGLVFAKIVKNWPLKFFLMLRPKILAIFDESLIKRKKGKSFCGPKIQRILIFPNLSKFDETM